MNASQPSPIGLLNSILMSLRPPVDLMLVARELGLEVRERTDMTANEAGRIIPDTKARAGFAIEVNANDNPRRRRFTLAHELAHYVFHRDLIGDGVFDDANYRSPTLDESYEAQASRMAVDILTPPQMVE